jgi:anti-sigma-K factor RskA
MSHEAYADLAAGYALDALEPEERAQFQAHVATGCPECQAALTAYGETLVALAREMPRTPAPPEVKAALLRRIAAAQPAARPDRTPARRVGPAVWVASLAAAAALLLYLGLQVADLRRELAARTEEAATLRAEIARQRDLLALLGAPGTRAVALDGRPPSPAARGRMWWNGDQRAGLFLASGLPALPPGMTYQLWVISEGKPISAGTFAVDPRGEGSLRVEPLAAVVRAEVFAVTLEPAGGRPAPTGEMYLAGQAT